MVKDIKYNSESYNEEIKFDDIFSIFTRNKLLIFCLTATSFLASALYAISLARTWSGDFQIVLKKQESSFNNMRETNNKLDILRNLESSNSGGLITQIEILKSPSVLMPIFELVKEKYNKNDNNISDLSYRKWFSQSIDIKLLNKTEVLNVSYKDKNKEFILPVLQEISKTYKQYSGKTKLRNLNSGIDYLDNQIEIYKEKQLSSLKELQDFAYINDLSAKLDLGDGPNSINVESIRINESNKIRTINKYLEKVSKDSTNPKSLLYFETIFPSFSSNQIRLTTERINNDLIKARAKFKPGDKEILRLENNLRRHLPLLKNELINFLNSKKYEAEAKLDASKRNKKIIARYKQLISNAAMEEATLSSLNSQRRSLSLAKAQTTDPWDLITKPTLKNYPIAPNRKKITFLGTLLGVMISILISIILEKRKGIIYSENEVENLLGFTLIKILDIKKKDTWSSSISLINRSNIFSKNKEFAFLKLGFVEENLFEELKNIIQNTITNKKVSYTSNINLALDYSNIILVIQLGQITHKDLNSTIEELNFQDYNIQGIIYLK